MATLSEDQVDDILYYARAGETANLVSTLKSIIADASTPFKAEAEVLELARDEYSGNNALHMASGNGHLETVKEILSLLPKPANQNAPPHAIVAHKNSSGNTPLHWAALNGHAKIVEVLVLAANADPTVTNNAGHDPVYEAELNEKMDVVEWCLGNYEGLQEGVGEKGGEKTNGNEESSGTNGPQSIQDGMERLDLYKGDSRDS